MKHYTKKEINFYKRLFEEFIDRDLPNSQLKAEKYADIAKKKDDDAFFALFKALAHDGPSGESRKKASRILEPWYAIFLCDENLEFYVSYYAALLMSINDSNALKVCDEILGNCPDSFQALTSKGIILRRKGNYFQAIDLFIQALEIRPNSPWPLKHLARAYNQGKVSKKKDIALAKNSDVAYINGHKTKIRRIKKTFNYQVFWGHHGKVSREIAECLKGVLENIFPGMTPFYSEEDIYGGHDWYIKILKQLEKSDFGIFCFTSKNLNNKWMHFEAGALSLPPGGEKIIPFLFYTKPDKLKAPLVYAQCVDQSKRGFKKLLNGINEKSEVKYTKRELENKLDKYWSGLNKEFIRISNKHNIKRTKS